MDIKKIIADAKTKVGFYVNGKYNYAPIKSLNNQIFKNGDVSRKNFARYYKALPMVTDAKTFFVYEFSRFDIYVSVSSLVYVMGKAFPEISKDTVLKWINEKKEDHHIIVA